ncbi:MULTISPECIES: hypothetical protein [unclassified Leptospira]|nr:MULTISPECIES: hypothetical protein [unclassified Leptospira]
MTAPPTDDKSAGDKKVTFEENPFSEEVDPLLQSKNSNVAYYFL